MGQRITQVDAFTDRPFGGNPAGVCILDRPRTDTFMQDVAREMNLSETAFVLPLEAEAGAAPGSGRPGEFRSEYRLRWFTPTTEVDLCGHATLAAAHVLWEEGRLAPHRTAYFRTRSGLLTADRREDSSGGVWITLDFPARPPRAVAEPPPGLLDALRLEAVGARVLYLGFDGWDYIVEVGAADAEEAVRSLQPDFAALGRIKARGVVVTARAGEGRPAGSDAGRSAARGGRRAAGRDGDPAAGEGAGYDFVSRFFAPAIGVPEDPVTGSSHCCLGPYWGERLGKVEMTGRQVSVRAGTVRVRLAGERVKLAGQAVTVLRGELVEM